MTTGKLFSFSKPIKMEVIISVLLTSGDWIKWDNAGWSLQKLLLLSRFSHVQLCATPQMAAHQAPPSLGFSRQGHWSGLPFPSPMHESEKWKWSRSVVSDPTLSDPWTAAYQTPPSMGFSRQEYWSGAPLPSPSLQMEWAQREDSVNDRSYYCFGL